MMNLTIRKNTKGPREVLLDMGEKFLRASILERTTKMKILYVNIKKTDICFSEFCPLSPCYVSPLV